MFKFVCLLNNVIIDALDFPRLLKILPDNIYLIVVEKEHFNTKRVFNLEKTGKWWKQAIFPLALFYTSFDSRLKYGKEQRVERRSMQTRI